MIEEHFFERPVIEGEKIERHKGSFSWNMALTARVVYASRTDDPENERKNMLIAYPGAALYSSKEIAPGEMLEKVLDLAENLP
jgi:hypothetical protein